MTWRRTRDFAGASPWSFAVLPGMSGDTDAQAVKSIIELVLVLSILGVFSWVRNLFFSICRGTLYFLSTPHRHRTEELRLRAEIAQGVRKEELEDSPEVPLPKPGPCVHRNVVAIIPANEDAPVGWLCRCGEQLPADWAVRKEDL
jgi:hypothetical protein